MRMAVSAGGAQPSAVRGASRINFCRARSLPGRRPFRFYKTRGEQGRGSLPLPFARISHALHLPLHCASRRLRSARALLASAAARVPHLLRHGSDPGVGPLPVAPVNGGPTVIGGVGARRAVDAGRRRPKRGFHAPASRFMWGLCHHYRVELHNFAPNTISQVASFVAIARDSWGSRCIGTCGSTSSMDSSTLSPRERKNVSSSSR
jgi:hypothetical protein